MLVDPVMPQYASLRSLLPTATAHPSVSPIPSVIPDLPIYQQIGHSGVVVLWIIFIGMLLSTIIFISMAWRVPVEKQLFHIIMTFIMAFATISYFGMATGGGSSFVHTVASKNHHHTDQNHHQDIFRQVFWARYVDWVLTTPLLLLNLAFLAGLNGADIIIIVVADISMVLMGLFSAFGVSESQRWGYYAMIWIAYIVLVYRLVAGCRRSAANNGSSTAKSFSAIGGFILIVWALYLIVWAMGPGSHRLSVNTEIVWYAILDVLAKPVIGIWLLAAYARNSTAPSIEGFWSHGLNAEGTLRLDNDESP